MEEMGLEDRAVALKHSSRMRSLANVEKRSRGQLKGLKRAQITAGRAAEEARLQSFIESDPQRAQKYGTVLKEIAGGYADMGNTADYELTISNLNNASRALYFAWLIYDAAMERQKPDLERESAYMERNVARTMQRLKLAAKDWHPETDRAMLQGMVERLSGVTFPADAGVDKATLLADLNALSDDVIAAKWNDPDFIDALLKKSPEELSNSDDPFIQVMTKLHPEYSRLRALGKQRSGKMDKLYGSLIEVKQDFLKTQFVPDANGTLRMTFGRVEGYSPEDAVLKTPITTLSGVIDKTTGVTPFQTPQRIVDLYGAKEFGPFALPGKEDLAVAILYSTDTTGGNSGSPILNAKGNLVGVNFDRAFEATINDFAWNQSYSRSIGVDIRYALWITGEVFGAEHLLKEMGVPSQ